MNLLEQMAQEGYLLLADVELTNIEDENARHGQIQLFDRMYWLHYSFDIDGKSRSHKGFVAFENPEE